MNISKILENKTVVISGGTKGVGRALVAECAKQGANVVFGGRDEKAAEEIIDAVAKTGRECSFVYTDLHNAACCAGMFDRAADEFGKVDGFVNYAGITTVSALTDCSGEQFDDIFAVNVRAAFFCAQNAVRRMKQSGGGSIVMIGSAHAWGGEKDRAAYAVSKGALYTLTEHIAHHYSHDHIRCNYLTMGWTPTEGELELRRAQGISEKTLHETASRLLPMGRMCRYEDIIPGVIFLLSDYSSMMTGANLRITAGEYI